MKPSVKKENLRSFKVNRVYLDLLNINLVPRAFPSKNGWGKALGTRLAQYVSWILKGFYSGSKRGRKIRRRRSTSSIKRQIRRLHVVVVQWTSKKCTKKRDARAELLFWSLNLLFFWSRRCGLRRSCLSSLLGTSGSDDGDGNGNATKTIGLISKATILHVHHAFWNISLPSLHDYDMKMPNFTMYRGSTLATTKFPLSFWTWIWFLGIQL